MLKNLTINKNKTSVIELNEIEEKYFALMEDRISFFEFEEWVYRSKWLENELSKDEYLDLISLDFMTPSMKYEVGKILKSKINEGKFQEITLLNFLESIIVRDGKEGESLIRLYDLYCDGYYFLQDLGLGIGLQIDFPPSEFGVDYYHELNENQKKQLIDSVYPAAKELAEELKDWIINKELVLTGELDDDFNRWQFIDKRTEEDKQSRIWKEVKNKKTDTIRTFKNLLSDKFDNFLKK